MTQIIVSGASSQVGFALLPRLAAAGDVRVMALSRQAAPAWHQPGPAIEWIHPAHLPAAVDGSKQQILLSAGPLDLCVDWLDQMPGPIRVVALSTASMETKTGPITEEEAEQLEHIRNAEQALQAFAQQRNIHCLILRPTLIWGSGLDRNVMQLARWIQRAPVIPVFAGGNGQRQPLHVEDLADIMMQLASTRHEGIWPVAGGETLSFRMMINRIAEALDRDIRILSVPAPLGSLALRVLHPLGYLAGITPSMLQRQGQDLLVNDKCVREALRFSPRGFRPVPEELRAPGTSC